jgi:transposase
MPSRSKVEIEMSRQVTIETPIPTIEETAHILGVSLARVRRVQKLLAERKARGRSKTNGRLRRASKYAAKRASKRA